VRSASERSTWPFSNARHRAGAQGVSIRCQEIVTALRGSLDLSAGPIATQLDDLYDFVLRRLEKGN
jgi:flagellin-specific chaperone FliS